MLNRAMRRPDGLLPAMLILPWAIPATASPESGAPSSTSNTAAINQVLGVFGIAPIPVALGPFWNFVGHDHHQCLARVPFMMVIVLGGLQSISTDYYEAAETTGRQARSSQFRNITLPLLRPVLLPAVLLGTFLDLQQHPGAVLHQSAGARDQ